MLALLLNVRGKVGHANQSQHYAGVAFDVGQNLSASGRLTMRNLAASSGIWTYVEEVTQVLSKKR